MQDKQRYKWLGMMLMDTRMSITLPCLCSRRRVSNTKHGLT